MDRIVTKTEKRGQQSIREMLTSLLVPILVSPSKELLLASAWITDFELLDNRLGNWNDLEPMWGARMISFSEVLGLYCKNGGKLKLITRKEGKQINERFLRRLRNQVRRYDVQDRLEHKIIVREHKKFLIGDKFLVMGSMNFTYSGVEGISGETITLTTQEQMIQQMRVEFKEMLTEL